MKPCLCRLSLNGKYSILSKSLYTILKDLKFQLETGEKSNFVEQNNYVKRSNQLLEHQNLSEHCSLFLRFQQYYFDGPTKLFLDLYPVKF